MAVCGRLADKLRTAGDQLDRPLWTLCASRSPYRPGTRRPLSRRLRRCSTTSDKGLIGPPEIRPREQRHPCTAPGQADNLVRLLDALDGVVISDTERGSLTWLSGLETRPADPDGSGVPLLLS